jgi:hypothetical protein
LLLAAMAVLAALLTGESVALAFTLRGGAVKSLVVASAISTATITSTSWTDVSEMSVTLSVPSGQQGLLLITFSATGSCTDDDGLVNGWCWVRVLVDGFEASPSQTTWDSAADSNNGNAREAASMQWFRGPINAGQHVVTVQARVDQAVPGTFLLHNRVLSVLRAKVG